MTETVFGVGNGEVKAVKDTVAAPVDVSPVSKPEPVEIESAAPSFMFLGQNKRNYLFLTDERQHDWMSEAAMDAFVKTLAALKFTMDDVALLNVAKLQEPPSFDDLALFFKPKVVVSLGVSLRWPEREDITVFRTDTFDAMIADAEKKRTFWATIKTLLT